MTPEKRGRSVHAVTFRWRWKDPHDAAETVAENAIGTPGVASRTATMPRPSLLMNPNQNRL